MDKRKARHSATREKALLSLVFNIARGAGLTSAPNPCVGVRGFTSKRDVYVTDDELSAVLAHAERPLQDFLLLAWRTGADASIVLAMRRADVRDGALWTQRSKTGAKVRINIVGPLQAVLARLARKPAKVTECLVRDERGQRLTLSAWRKRANKARAAAGFPNFKLQDIRRKAGSDVTLSIGSEAATALLGHRNKSTTDRYISDAIGRSAEPVLREGRGIAGKRPKAKRA